MRKTKNNVNTNIINNYNNNNKNLANKSNELLINSLNDVLFSNMNLLFKLNKINICNITTNNNNKNYLYELFGLIIEFEQIFNDLTNTSYILYSNNILSDINNYLVLLRFDELKTISIKKFLSIKSYLIINKNFTFDKINICDVLKLTINIKVIFTKIFNIKELDSLCIGYISEFIDDVFNLTNKNYLNIFEFIFTNRFNYYYDSVNILEKEYKSIINYLNINLVLLKNIETSCYDKHNNYNIKTINNFDITNTNKNYHNCSYINNNDKSKYIYTKINNVSNNSCTKISNNKGLLSNNNTTNVYNNLLNNNYAFENTLSNSNKTMQKEKNIDYNKDVFSIEKSTICLTSDINNTNKGNKNKLKKKACNVVVKNINNHIKDDNLDIHLILKKYLTHKTNINYKDFSKEYLFNNYIMYNSSLIELAKVENSSEKVKIIIFKKIGEAALNYLQQNDERNVYYKRCVYNTCIDKIFSFLSNVAKNKNSINSKCVNKYKYALIGSLELNLFCNIKSKAVYDILLLNLTKQDLLEELEGKKLKIKQIDNSSINFYDNLDNNQLLKQNTNHNYINISLYHDENNANLDIIQSFNLYTNDIITINNQSIYLKSLYLNSHNIINRLISIDEIKTSYTLFCDLINIYNFNNVFNSNYKKSLLLICFFDYEYDIFNNKSDLVNIDNSNVYYYDININEFKNKLYNKYLNDYKALIGSLFINLIRFTSLILEYLKYLLEKKINKTCSPKKDLKDLFINLEKSFHLNTYCDLLVNNVYQNNNNNKYYLFSMFNVLYDNVVSCSIDLDKKKLLGIEINEFFLSIYIMIEHFNSIFNLKDIYDIKSYNLNNIKSSFK